MGARGPVLVVALLFGIPLLAAAGTLRVPGDLGTLTAAIAAAQPGDEIVLEPGRYAVSTGETFPLRLAGKSLRIRGQSAAQTILDAEETAAHFEFAAGDTSTLADLTLAAGHSDGGGGAILVDGGSSTLVRCVITGCTGSRDGDAVFVRRGEAHLTHCLFAANGDSGPTVCITAGAANLERCTWSANAGPALELRGAPARVTRCMIANPGQPGGRSVGVVIVAGDVDAAPSLSENLFSGCVEGCVRVEGSAGARLAAALDDARARRGLRSGDVRFVDAAHGDYRLAERGSVGNRDVGAFGGSGALTPAPAPSVSAPDEEPAGETLLGPSVPNPFAPQTTIHFTVPAASVVDLGIYNVLGQRVRTLLSGDLSAGEHSRDWNGRDDHDEELPPGIYFVRITIGDVTESRRLVLVR